MTIRLLHGDCRDVLPTLADASVHCVVTSPPYFGLRDYGTGTWEGGDAACSHRRQEPKRGNAAYVNGQGQAYASNLQSWGDRAEAIGVYRDLCGKCGARRIDRQIGLESSPDEYLATMVDVFREVRRVLRPDGVCWVNMGDSYSGSPAGNKSSTEFGERGGRYRLDNYRKDVDRDLALPAKNLLMMPARLAIALQADGWFLRSMLPWLKRSAMPESVTDRPASAVEYVFLLTKQARYFWDQEACKRGAAPDSAARYAAPFHVGTKETNGGGRPDNNPNSAGMRSFTGTRNMRNSDLFFDSLEDAPEPAPKMRNNPIGGTSHKERGQHGEGGAMPVVDARRLNGPEPLGLICDDAGEPLALDVNPAGFAQAHFATFPEKLVAPLIRAGTSERGCCAACGAPWVRVVERGERHGRTENDGAGYVLPKGDHTDARIKNRKDAGWLPNHSVEQTTTGWSASCAHTDAGVVPATILDPFAGAGTTLLVADRLQRDAIGIELSDAYGSMASARVVDDAPLLAWLEAAE